MGGDWEGYAESAGRLPDGRDRRLSRGPRRDGCRLQERVEQPGLASASEAVDKMRHRLDAERFVMPL